jgi:hypothetical protein
MKARCHSQQSVSGVTGPSKVSEVMLFYLFSTQVCSGMVKIRKFKIDCFLINIRNSISQYFPDKIIRYFIVIIGIY